jgi:hypothetical protein
MVFGHYQRSTGTQTLIFLSLKLDPASLERSGSIAYFPNHVNLHQAACEVCVLVICAGMYRSGSTWQYNIASHLVEQNRRGSRRGFFRAEEFVAKGLAETPIEPDSPLRVIKTHDRHDCFARLLRNRRAVAVYSYRDLRDVTYSLMPKLRLTFEDLLFRERVLDAAIDNDGFWRNQPHALCQEYGRITSSPDVCIAEIANHLGIKIGRDEAEFLAREYSLHANRRRADRLQADLIEQGIDLNDPRNALINDPHTLLHWNHVRTGRNGSWRQLATPFQKVQLARICGRWLVARGYEKDESWAVSVEGLLGDISEVHRRCDGLAQELQMARDDSAALRERLTQFKRESDCLRQQLADAQTRLESVAGFGPQTLRVARRLQHLARQHPTLAAWCKLALSLLRRRAA